jgi:hypothetical protein
MMQITRIYATSLVAVVAIIIVLRVGLGDYTLERRLDTESIALMTREEIMKRGNLMVEWYTVNQRDDGSLPYTYDPASESYGTGDNMIRQFITAQGAYALSKVFDDEALHERAGRHIDVLLKDGYEMSEGGEFAYIRESNGDVKLGAAALAILALREGKDDAEPLSEQERKFGDFLLRMQRSDGSFQTFLHDPASTENDRFYSGEALSAIARLYAISNDERYRSAMERGFAHYSLVLENEFAPQYAPWHIQAYALAYSSTNDAAYVAHAFMLADSLVEEMLYADSDALPDEVGRFYNPEKRSTWGPPHSSSSGIYVEGLTYAYALASDLGDAGRAQIYREAIVLGMRYLAQVQFTEKRAKGFAFPERVRGALKENISDFDIRIDQTGHAMNALARIVTLLDHE